MEIDASRFSGYLGVAAPHQRRVFYANHGARPHRPGGARTGPPPLRKIVRHFKCQCGSEWISAHVWVVAGTHKVFHRQDCKECHVACNPFKVEERVCQLCMQEQRVCVCDKSHLKDTKKPHVQMLCYACRDRPTPCSGRSE